MEKKRTRSNSLQKQLQNVTYKERAAGDSINSPRLVDGKYIIERMMGHCKSQKGLKHVSVHEASAMIAKEICQDWILKNVYPENERNVSDKIKKDYEKFKNYVKQNNSNSHKKTDAWYSKVTEFNDKMTKNAYNIRTNNSAYQKKLEDIYGVKMTKEVDQFFNDNCFGDYKATCKSTVSKSWLKHKKRQDKRKTSAKNKEEDILDQRMIETEENEFEHVDSTTEHSDSDDNVSLEQNTPIVTRKLKTRNMESSHELEKDVLFPRVKIRQSFREINEKVMWCVTQCIADYKDSANELVGM